MSVSPVRKELKSHRGIACQRHPIRSTKLPCEISEKIRIQKTLLSKKLMQLTMRDETQKECKHE